MRSIKPGRGPSFMGGVASILASIAGIAWTVGAANMGAPVFMWIFGLVFTGMALAGAIYNFTNATSPNRMSDFDITDGDEEPDPLNERFGSRRQEVTPSANEQAARPVRRYPGEYCPFCGAEVKGDFDFCPKCGKDI